ncbi:MAG: YihA family ribosome biogenesis GTP-binding protein [Bacteroidetes bacterium]|nr:YihA family ribosome biogenesis GTP-binding protein [Bacteroidota bacterium]MBS1931358.1 YihA family ribosome biogenesis GTP-binding protein [Bacteroidota bacterium]
MEIISASYKISNADYKACPEPDRPEYAFIGRSNVGKSSLINMLCNSRHLAKTSATPGKTQLINHFDIISDGSGKDLKDSKWYLVDLPGYGYASVSRKERKSWSGMIENYIRKRTNLVCLFVLIDSRHDPQLLDIEFINTLGAWRINFVLVFTKSDKNKRGETEKHIESFFQVLSKTWEEMPLYFITSAEKKTGRTAILDFITISNQQYFLQHKKSIL